MSRTLIDLRTEMLGAEAEGGLMDLPAQTHASARNLLHYLALRRHDLRGLQRQLDSLGLSSLEGAEARALENVEAVIGILRRLEAALPAALPPPNVGRALLDAHTDALFGPAPPGRTVRIMVTMPTEAAHDYTLVRNLLTSGMDCMRINCAHDDPDVWERTLRHLRRASDDIRRPCRTVMDLAGPKLRTGGIERGPRVVRWRPDRDAFGQVTAPARIWLTPAEHPRAPTEPAAATLPVRGSWVAQLTVGDRIKQCDAIPDG